MVRCMRFCVRTPNTARIHRLEKLIAIWKTMTAINIAMTSVSCQLLFLCVATSMAILVIATKARPEPTDNKPVTVLSTVCTRNFRP